LGAPGEVADLVPADLLDQMHARETVRTRVCQKPEPLDLHHTIEFLATLKGPRLAILNTVQNAAVLAEELRKQGEDVVHLSTALTPRDRGRIVERIRERLQDDSLREWTLVATSCVEAGVDFSFRSAVRERCSAASLVQTGGRVNREGTREADEVWDVRLLLESPFNCNQQFRRSRDVLGELFEEGLVERLPPAELVTEAMRRELLRWWDNGADEIQEAEAALDFVKVAKLYRVIEGDSRLVVADTGLLRRLRERDKVSSRELLLGSVQMWVRKAEELRLRELPMLPGVYEWTAPYDPDFLGYMAGVLPLVYATQSGVFLQ
jgi:CRISPR-associated endonuclease/helicase Cas3